MDNHIYEVMRVIRDIDNDHRHPLNNPHDPAHRQARLAYNELTDWLSFELNRTGSKDYLMAPRCKVPPLRETRPGFQRSD